MWKPHDCGVATNEQMLHLVRRVWSRGRKVDIKGLVTLTITIVAFLFAVEYFTAEPSLSIAVHPDPYGYYMDSVLAFYKDRGLDLPGLLTEDPSLSKLFAEDTRLMDPNYIPLDAGTSDEEAIKAIARGQNMGWFVRYLTEQLERQVGTYTYVRHVYGGFDERGFHSEENFKPIRDYAKSKMLPTDYYTFLAALIHSREVRHVVFIKNDGDVDLKNVRITFPAPLSKVTNSRAGNILACSTYTALLHETIAGDLESTLHLPSLKKGEGASVDIRTRENEINSDEVFYSYERDKLIKRRLVIEYFCVIFVIMFILSLACQKTTGGSLKVERSGGLGMED